MFIPESLLQKEKDHVEGFAPEVAWVTHGGSEKLEERLCVRPTSETLFCEHYANIIHSYRDLPKLYNQWVQRRPLGKDDPPLPAFAGVLVAGGPYHPRYRRGGRRRDRAICWTFMPSFCEKYAVRCPVIKGRKTDSEKFAGAEATYTIEALMHDGKALQSRH